MWPVSGSRLRSPGQVPHPHRAVVAAADRHRPAVDQAATTEATGPAWPREGHVDGRRAPPGAGGAPRRGRARGRQSGQRWRRRPASGRRVRGSCRARRRSATEVRRGQLDDRGRLPRLGRAASQRSGRSRSTSATTRKPGSVSSSSSRPQAAAWAARCVRAYGSAALQSAFPAASRGVRASTIAAWVSAASTGQSGFSWRRAGSRRTSGGRRGTGRRVAGRGGTGRRSWVTSRAAERDSG